MTINWKNETRKIADLIPADYNPRKINEAQKQRLKQSLEKFNLADPLILNADNTIIGGHQRLKVLIMLDIRDVDVRVPDRLLSKEEEKELNIRLNKNTGDWDNEMLINFDEDFLFEIGFEDKELDIIFNKQKKKEKNADEVGETAPEIVNDGDIFKLGEHILLCGDSTEEENYKKLMGEEKIKLCFTSPPYNMAAKMYENYSDDKKSDEYIDFNLKIINIIKNYLNGFIFWNISYNKNSRFEFIEVMYKILKETGLRFLELIVWNKKHAMPITSKGTLTRQFEDILAVGTAESFEWLELFYVGSNKRKIYFNKKTNKGISNYWEIGTNNSQLKNHLAYYPVELPKKAIEMMTEKEEIIFDPFGGSGTTLMACEILNRKCRMIELDKKYCDIIINRWEKYTGQKAEKIK
jgi:DNA modification methylase